MFILAPMRFLIFAGLAQSELELSLKVQLWKSSHENKQQLVLVSNSSAMQQSDSDCLAEKHTHFVQYLIKDL